MGGGSPEVAGSVLRPSQSPVQSGANGFQLASPVPSLSPSERAPLPLLAESPSTSSSSSTSTSRPSSEPADVGKRSLSSTVRSSSQSRSHCRQSG